MDKYYLLYFFVFILSLFLTTVIEANLIPRLKRRASQPIYEGGPSWHMSKSGTPTMGGLAFIIAIGVATLAVSLLYFFSDESEAAISILLIFGYSCINAIIGLVDDLTKLKRKENAGLTPMQKLLFQLLAAVAFLFVRYMLFGDRTELCFGNFKAELGFLYYPFSVIVLLGTVNCANLTDGLDGLAGSVALTAGCSLFFISSLGSNDVAAVSVALVGGMLGFLIFNINPAKIFMGDVGSLFLGGIIASSAYALGSPLLILFVGIVYFIEGLSVILQVLYFKITKKRLFKMAPFHHHLEKCGFSETKICMIAIIVTLLFSTPAYLIFGS